MVPYRNPRPWHLADPRAIEVWEMAWVRGHLAITMSTEARARTLRVALSEVRRRCPPGERRDRWYSLRTTCRDDTVIIYNGDFRVFELLERLIARFNLEEYARGQDEEIEGKALAGPAGGQP